MRQFSLTPAAGKRLIGKGIAGHPEVLTALKDKTVVVIAGTTNGYVAQELLAVIGQADELHQAIENALSEQAERDYAPLFSRAKDELTVAAMTQQTLKIYEQLLQKA